MDNAAARTLHNRRAEDWLERLRETRRTQQELEVVALPEAPDGSRPQLKLENGRFTAYRFCRRDAEVEWIPDTGSSRIDAVLDRHFAGT